MLKRLIIATSICLISVFLMMSVFSNNSEYKIREPNYFGLVKLGLAPSTESRIPTENDIFTNVLIKDGDATYALFESRELSKLDFGKTFVVRVE